MPQRTRFEMPILLLAGMGLGVLLSGALIVVVLSVGALAMSVALGVPVAGTSIEGASWPALAQFAVLATLVFATTYGLLKQKPWSRELIVFFWINLLAMASIPPLVDGDALGFAAVAGLYASVFAGVTWYLYRKATVAAYYSALWQQRLRRAGVSPADTSSHLARTDSAKR